MGHWKCFAVCAHGKFEHESGGHFNHRGSQPHENMSPYLVLNFVIALQGIFPSQN